jgi:two-component system chemotaxis response regulator CheY
MRALVVEDSSTIRKVLCLYLRNMNIQSVEAADGLEGLDRLNELPLDLVLLDWQMPRMDGLTFLRELRKMPAYDALPVIMITTNPEAEYLGQAMEAGANEYIQKPCTLDGLREKLDALGFVNL